MNSENYIDFKKKKLDEESSEIVCSEPIDNVIKLEKMILNFFTCQKFITPFLHARENILSQSNNGKMGYYTFSYPNLGWVQYDHNSIQTIYTLSELKSKEELYKSYINPSLSAKLKLHSIAALIIKCSDVFYNLYEGLEKAREFVKENRLVYITFTNPFYGFIKTSTLTKQYTGEEIISLYNIGLTKKFKSVFP
jgi:hypothetical protein